jgi:hypothetical protein
MSCMNNVDPHNNIPPKKPKTNQPQYQMPQQYPVQQYPVQQYPIQQYPVQQYPVQQGRPDPQTEIRLLQNDLDVAISYIQKLGGRWPPPRF